MEIHHVVRHEFTCSALEDDTFQVAEFNGRESISQTFEFEVDLVSRDEAIDFEDVINKPATLSIARGGDEASEINGIVVDFVQSYEVEGFDGYKRYLYRVVLVPRLWRLGLSNQSRIFQDLTVQDIVTNVLKDAGVDHEWNLAGSYEPREYTTQYKESDLDFVQRLLEFEGIRYYFRHEDGNDTVVMSDDAGDSEPIEDEPVLPYNNLGSPLTDAVLGLTARRRLVTLGTETKDYNYRTPAADLLTKADDRDPETGFLSDSMIHTGTQTRSDALTKIRAEEFETQRLVMTGSSNCFRLRTGFRFDLEGHFRKDINQSYLITEVTHRGSEADVLGAGTGGDRESGYQNEFTCVPASAPYRPPRITPIPKLPGVLTAKVESAGGEYAPIDDQGRYRVRFPFDLGKEGAAQATKPVRLAQPYSGPEYGQHFPVHKDAEMVVACVDGNVDRIIGLSTVPNPNQASPVTKNNQTENTVLTAAGNRIMLQDLKGKVGVDIKTPTAKSRIHLGAAEDAVEGIQSSTDATQSIHAGNGVFIKTGKLMGDPDFVMAAKDLGDMGSAMTAVDGAIGVALAALGVGSGFLKNKSFWQSFVNTGAGTAAGLLLPGIFMASEGGIIMGTTAGISAYAGTGGIGLTTTSGIDLTSATMGINLMAGTGGISMGVGSGDIDMANGRGDIKVNSKTGNILTEAQDDIRFKSKEKNFSVKTKLNIHLEADKQFSGMAETIEFGADKSVEVSAGTHIELKADDKITLKCGQSSIAMSKDGSITIKAGQNKIEMGASGIEVKAAAQLKMKGTAGAELAGMNVKVKADVQAALEGVMADVKGSGIASIKGALTKVG
ncbi:type VI secretion system tip protein TssI/VgrG [Rubrivirga sp.]|uniref:type VI secretion system tip protein TssI/VgrG n=1 Tax=Rubrivirga sp. TaxID=1885344 RepID=UPI003C73D13C